MTSLGFENYSEALKIYLSKYREVGSPLSYLTEQESDRPRRGANDYLQQSQSNRSENQQGRPGSQGGYGAQGGAAGPSNSGSSTFQTSDLAGQGADGAEPNYMYQPGHNGTGAGEGY